MYRMSSGRYYRWSLISRSNGSRKPANACPESHQRLRIPYRCKWHTRTVLETRVPINVRSVGSADSHGSRFRTHASCEQKDQESRMVPISFRESVAEAETLLDTLARWHFPDASHDAPEGSESCGFLAVGARSAMGIRDTVRHKERRVSTSFCPLDGRDVNEFAARCGTARAHYESRAANAAGPSR